MSVDIPSFSVDNPGASTEKPGISNSRHLACNIHIWCTVKNAGSPKRLYHWVIETPNCDLDP